MPNHITPAEQTRLDEIEVGLSALAQQAEPLKHERKVILARVRQRKFNQS